MLGYNELYEILRKEKYSDALQPLQKSFITEFKEYIKEQSEIPPDTNLLSDSANKSKKQLENAFSIFRELMLKRKRKLLNLIFIAAETGIMKKDYENMLDIEKKSFDTMVKSFEDSDRELNKLLNDKTEKKQAENKMLLFKQNIEEFINHEGKSAGPFKLGDLVNIESRVADILVSEGKASFVDQE